MFAVSDDLINPNHSPVFFCFFFFRMLLDSTIYRGNIDRMATTALRPSSMGGNSATSSSSWTPSQSTWAAWAGCQQAGPIAGHPPGGLSCQRRWKPGAVTPGNLQHLARQVNGKPGRFPLGSAWALPEFCCNSTFSVKLPLKFKVK